MSVFLLALIITSAKTQALVCGQPRAIALGKFQGEDIVMSIQRLSDRLVVLIRNGQGEAVKDLLEGEVIQQTFFKTEQGQADAIFGTTEYLVIETNQRIIPFRLDSNSVRALEPIGQTQPF